MDPDPWQTECNSSIFEDLASSQPLKVALISRHGVLTYAALNERANQLAHHLRSCGIGPESVIGVRLERGIEYIISMLGIWKAGGAYLPLDVSLPLERIKFMVSDANTTHIISKRQLVDENLLGTEINALYLDDEGLQSTLDKLSGDNMPQMADHNSLAYILLTSGTSGKPKGVAITHGSIVNMANDTRKSREICAFDTVLLFAPFCFDASIRDIHGALLTGATLYVPEEDEILPGNIIDTLSRQQITYVVVTPSVLRACRVEKLPLLQTIVVAGEAVNENVIKNWGEGRTIINAYGPTEATTGSPISIGNPILNTQVHILDDMCRPVSPGGIGEIYIHGLGVSQRGYLNLPELNTQCFRDDMFPGPGRTYRTGDLGRLLPSGEVEFLGRKNVKAQIKLHGQRIETEEIENILRTDVGVLDGVVVLRGAEGFKSLVAYVVPVNNLECDRQELICRLELLFRSNLPAYSVPSAVCVIDSFPTHTTGKLNVNALPDPASQQLVTSNKASAAGQELSQHQRGVADALLEALGLLSSTCVTPGTTYGELGGTSLQASVVLQHINKIFGCKLLLGQIYRQKMTVEWLAHLVSQSWGAATTENKLSLITDLNTRVQLPSDVVPCRQIPSPEAHNHILLTGATGYLGAHALSEILKSSTANYRVTYVVRAADADAAWSRIRSTMLSWGIWDDNFTGRFRAVAGNISEPFLGMSIQDYLRLAEEVGTVWHCAAVVNFIAPFEDLEDTNVAGTVEVLRFASTIHQKRLVYVSTLAVFFGMDNNKLVCAPETSSGHLSRNIVTGYAQTKWVGEQLVLQYQRRGGHVLICRPARLLGNETSGRCPRDDMTVRMIASFIEIGLAPDIDWCIDLTPVDACARALVDLAGQGRMGIYHFINQRTITLHGVIHHLRSSLGYRHIKLVPYQEWKSNLSTSLALQPLATLFNDHISVDGGRWSGSTFDILLKNQPFRTSSYSTLSITSHLRETQIMVCAAPQTLLSSYLTKSDDITSLFMTSRRLPPSLGSRTTSAITSSHHELNVSRWAKFVAEAPRAFESLVKMKLKLRQARREIRKKLQHSEGLKRRGTGSSATIQVVG